METEKFICRAIEIHGNKYDYSKAIYVASKNKLIISCQVHGDFLKSPHNHIHNKQGCPLCTRQRKPHNYIERVIPDGIITPEGAKAISTAHGTYAFVDEEDYDRVSKLSWLCKKNGYSHAWVSKTERVLMHRFILGVSDPNSPVDHINGVRYDNRKSNLRACSWEENARNRIGSTRSSSKYKGIYFEASSNKWVALIQTRAKKIHLGRFQSESDAARAYDEAALQHFGEFARTNLK